MKRALLAGCLAVAVSAGASPAARAVDPEAIDKAVDRGLEFLHSRDALANVPDVMQPVGATALVGLTLLECGAGADDPAVRHAAEVVRSAAPGMNQTYTLSLSILFLDRLGDPNDEPLIQSMAVRLMGGQNSAGGWGYPCPDLAESEVRRLTSVLQHPAEAGRDAPRDEKGPDGKPVKRTVKDLPKEIQDQIAHINTAALDTTTGLGDNSNTQFATLALWVARRHGLPVDRALARIEQRFRATQSADGGWSYMPNPVTGAAPPPGFMGGSSATMTCAGLIGLAAGQGATAEAAAEKGKPGPDLAADRGVKKALALLGTAVGAPVGKDGPVPTVGGKSFYFFWSLERVGVILDLDTIGGHDWYAWGSEILVANQGADGSWHGEYPQVADTCFALLFLKRANVARDLTSALKGKLQDSVTLKSGGVGGDSVKGVEPKDPPKPDETLTVAKPPKDPPTDETEGGRLARELVQAPAERRDDLVQKYRDGKGVTYTEALSGAIPQLTGEDKRKARDALAERLTRMKSDTLSRYFQDQDAEIRRAAALASAMKEAKTLIPDLIPLLSDPEPAVAHAAHAALKDLSGQNLGPSEDEWKMWWKNRDR